MSEGGKSGCEVAGRGLDHGCLLANLTSFGSTLEDPVGGAVLDAANRVDILELCEKVHTLHGQLHMRSGPKSISKQFQTCGETRCRDPIENRRTHGCHSLQRRRAGFDEWPAFARVKDLEAAVNNH